MEDSLDTTQQTDTTPEFTLPESFTGNTAFEGIDSLETLATKYSEVHSSYSELQSSQPVIPETPDAYELTVPDGQTVDTELMNNFKAWAHDAKIPNETAQSLSDKFNGWASEALAAQEVEKENLEAKQIDGLKKEWGTDFEKKAKVANDGLQRFYQEAGIEPEAMEEFRTKFGNDPTAIKMFHAIGSMIGESPTFTSDGNAPKGTGYGVDANGVPMIMDYNKIDK